jgi:hypothetical protein
MDKGLKHIDMGASGILANDSGKNDPVKLR